MDRESAKSQVKGYLQDYLQEKGINTSRPFHCLNPAHPDKHPSMSYDRQRQRCKCFSCGATYDIFDLIGMDYGLTDPKEVFDKAYQLYNITIDASPAKSATPAPTRPAADYMAYYKKAEAALPGSSAEAYLRQRGISNEIARRYMLGYDPAFRTKETSEDGAEAFTTWRALVIPTGKGSFVARNIDKPKEPAKKNRYRNRGASQIYALKELYNAATPTFIVEGEIDALSIMEAGGAAVGLGSADNYTQLLDLVRQQAPAQPLILALDNDEVGRDTTKKLADGLTAQGIPFYQYNPYGDLKDANEALVADRDAFVAELAAGERAQEAEKEAAAAAARDEYLKTSAAAHIQEFVDGISKGANTPCINTGFLKLDEILDGGLYPGFYVLGAMTSLGKTTLALQIADQIAQQGQDVLIFSLEMARTELMAKSVSRHTYLLAEDPRDAKTTRGILAGGRYAGYSSKEHALIGSALDAYQKYAHHIFIHEGVGDIGVAQIKAEVQKHITITGNTPLILIDYLQILAPYDLRASDKQNTDKAVVELKRLSRDYQTPVLAISSFNREAYKATSANNGKVTLADFKESGAIEYTADVVLGLEFESAGSGKEYSEKDEKRKDPRQIRLVVLKNRNGKAWTTASYEFYPLFNFFSEI